LLGFLPLLRACLKQHVLLYRLFSFSSI